MTVLQLPTAYFIPRIGYKGFVLFGWSIRAVLLFVLALLPLLIFFTPAIQIELMLTCLFLFNVVRGVSTGAWLPWLTALVPANARSGFLRFDQLHMQCGGLLAIAISTLVLWSGAQPWQFALLFFISALAGTLSLHFVRKIPDVEIGEQVRSSGHPVPWLEILKYPPFTKLLVFNVVYNWVVGGLAAFVIAFLEGRAGYTAGEVLAVSLASAVGAFASVPFFGLVLERTGSKPILRLAMTLYLLGIIFWVLVTSGTRPRPLSVRRIKLPYSRGRRRTLLHSEYADSDGYDAGDRTEPFFFTFHGFRLSESRSGSNFLGSLSRCVGKERVFDRTLPG